MNMGRILITVGDVLIENDRIAAIAPQSSVS